MGSSYQGAEYRQTRADGRVLYLNAGGGDYMNLHTGKNCAYCLYMHTQLLKSEAAQWTAALSVSWFWYHRTLRYCITVIEDVTILGNWLEGTEALPVYLGGNFLRIYNYSQIKS